MSMALWAEAARRRCVERGTQMIETRVLLVTEPAQRLMRGILAAEQKE